MEDDDDKVCDGNLYHFSQARERRDLHKAMREIEEIEGTLVPGTLRVTSKGSEGAMFTIFDADGKPLRSVNVPKEMLQKIRDDADDVITGEWWSRLVRRVFAGGG